jgi:hypothetical protein
MKEHATIAEKGRTAGGVFVYDREAQEPQKPVVGWMLEFGEAWKRVDPNSEIDVTMN